MVLAHQVNLVFQWANFSALLKIGFFQLFLQKMFQFFLIDMWAWFLFCSSNFNLVDQFIFYVPNCWKTDQKSGNLGYFDTISVYRGLSN